ncbi:5-(carboxyamino)imidazole ribonucleotide synthase [Glaciecola sp. MH2013]|uniref:5-(carboxyamino)imidazole ribonucleotide synthase n=1 Tax=Glaciecola sp. MH2013 TaxID=2785524 RepID=UPI00189FFCAD|nr:5-(carboxyamino)imidazole ribonucleotide synthase [Glaciecola sp. MH2013]MBF7073995.1 5-(carboxyamino)imidazole ribonucleotide synthase [Glaciecola sp. MH2013]
MRVLVYGAGQLAQMMYLAAAPLGVIVSAVDVATETVVNPVSKKPTGISLANAIEEAQAITVEFEHVPEHLLVDADKSQKLYPNIASIMAGADRVREKALLSKYNIPNCPHMIINDVSQLDQVLSTLGERVIFKASRDGYDGYGQWRMADASDLDKLRTEFAALDLKKVPLVAETMQDFDREISLIGARDKDGNVKCFSLAENLHHQGQLHVSVAPITGLTESLQEKANKIFDTLATGMDYVGVLAVELFQCGDELLVNEIAPRVHNSGHWTQQGADTCQFEQHIRAVLNLPLGSTDAHSISAMVNIIGCTSFSRDLISIPGAHLHWYGKEVRAKRKMGHINVVASSHKALGDKLNNLLAFLPLEHFPELKAEAARLQAN